MNNAFRGKLTMLCVIVTGLFLGYLLWVRLQLGLVRFFDADEMAYLHWAHNVFVGNRPYIDFFLYVPAGFLYFLAPLFWVVSGATVLIAGRVLAFVVFIGIVFATMYIFWLVRRSWMALFAGVLLVFLPLPADKFLEIRPDNLAMLLALMGLAFQINALQQSIRNQGLALKSRWVWAGLFYGLSLLVLPKTAPQIVVALVVTVAWWWSESGTRRERFGSLWYFGAGCVAPLAAAGVWILAIGTNWQQFNVIIYSLTKAPFEAGRIAEVFPILQWQFFYPNVIYYGQSGWNTGLLVNHSIWAIGLVVTSIRLVTPYIPHGKRGMWIELLLAGSMMAYVVAFMRLYPMRHAQYLIPIAIFVAFYAADALDMVKNVFWQTTRGIIVFILLFGGILTGLYAVNYSVNASKLTQTNAQDVRTLEAVLAKVPKDAYVFDLVGSTIYFRDPYYASALPFGQYAPYFSHPLPPLIPALEKTHTAFIYEGSTGRVNTLNQRDQAFITTNFVADRTVSGLLIRK